MTARNTGSRRSYLVSGLMLILVLAVLGVYFWQHNKFASNTAENAKLVTANSQLAKHVSNLTNEVASESAQLKKKSSATIYHVGDTQCINGLCITLDSFQHNPPGNSPDSNQPGTMLVSAQLTVLNNGVYPSIFANKQSLGYEGLFSGSLIYTSDNLFWTPFSGGVGGGTFVNQIQDYPKTGQSETGTLVWEIPQNETVDSYLYGNLTWVL